MAAWLIQPKKSKEDAEFFKAQRAALRAPAALAKRLADIDAVRPLRRIYLMGCGRSGTWLLVGAFATLGEVEIVAEERPFEDFGVYTTDESTLLLKRDYTAYSRIKDIPGPVEIAAIVRHPFAVLTSTHPATKGQRPYHISPDRWVGEARALQFLVGTARPNTAIVRYEDLVLDPDKFQKALSEKFALPIRHAMADAHKVFVAPTEAASAMHGLRPIDSNSLEKYRQDQEKMTYLRGVRPQLEPMLTWVAERYGYDVTL